jgi:hypothetical protein
LLHWVDDWAIPCQGSIAICDVPDFLLSSSDFFSLGMAPTLFVAGSPDFAVNLSLVCHLLRWSSLGFHCTVMHRLVSASPCCVQWLSAHEWRRGCSLGSINTPFAGCMLSVPSRPAWLACLHRLPRCRVASCGGRSVWRHGPSAGLAEHSEQNAATVIHAAISCRCPLLTWLLLLLPLPPTLTYLQGNWPPGFFRPKRRTFLLTIHNYTFKYYISLLYSYPEWTLCSVFLDCHISKSWLVLIEY